jgi:hypothetical protein
LAPICLPRRTRVKALLVPFASDWPRSPSRVHCNCFLFMAKALANKYGKSRQERAFTKRERERRRRRRSKGKVVVWDSDKWNKSKKGVHNAQFDSRTDNDDKGHGLKRTTSGGEASPETVKRTCRRSLDQPAKVLLRIVFITFHARASHFRSLSVVRSVLIHCTLSLSLFLYGSVWFCEC